MPPCVKLAEPGKVLPLTVVALIPPLPIADSTPPVLIDTPFDVPCAAIWIGSAVEVPTVLILTNGPVRVFAVVSTKLNTAVVDAPVSAAPVQVKSEVDGLACAAHVNAVQSPAGIVIDSVPVGAVSADHTLDPPEPQSLPVSVITPVAPTVCKHLLPDGAEANPAKMLSAAPVYPCVLPSVES